MRTKFYYELETYYVFEWRIISIIYPPVVVVVVADRKNEKKIESDITVWGSHISPENRVPAVAAAERRRSWTCLYEGEGRAHIRERSLPYRYTALIRRVFVVSVIILYYTSILYVCSSCRVYAHSPGQRNYFSVSFTICNRSATKTPDETKSRKRFYC